MKHALAAATLALCLLAAPALSAPDAGETVDAFHAALAAGKAEEAAALLADDLVVYEEGHVEASKAEYLRSHLPQDIAFLRGVVETTTASRVVLRGETAWVIREGATKGTFQGREVDRVTSETVVLHLEADGWRIVHIHWSSHKAT
jgi:ketosteroid isomerase-like protein